MVIWRISKPLPTLRISTLSTVAYYWHFVDVLVDLFLLLLWCESSAAAWRICC